MKVLVEFLRFYQASGIIGTFETELRECCREAEAEEPLVMEQAERLEMELTEKSCTGATKTVESVEPLRLN